MADLKLVPEEHLVQGLLRLPDLRLYPLPQEGQCQPLLLLVQLQEAPQPQDPGARCPQQLPSTRQGRLCHLPELEGPPCLRGPCHPRGLSLPGAPDLDRQPVLFPAPHS